MSTRKCGCVYADSRNSSSVRNGYEMSGGNLRKCAKHKEPANESRELQASQKQEPSAWIITRKNNGESFLTDLKTDVDMHQSIGSSVVPLYAAPPAAPDVSGLAPELCPPGLYAVHLLDNWDGEGDTYHLIGRKLEDGQWVADENGKPLIQYAGDKILRVWSLAAPDVSALVEALEQAVTSMQDSGYQNSHPAVMAARAALSDYREQQEK